MFRLVKRGYSVFTKALRRRGQSSVVKREDQLHGVQGCLVNDVARFDLILLAAALLLLCGCINESGEVTGTSGLVRVYVLTAPACPVERVGPDCPPRPVSGAALVALAGDAVRGLTLTHTRRVPSASHWPTAATSFRRARSAATPRLLPST